MRALGIAVVAAGACSSDASLVATSYAQAAYCPDDRVHATALPQLALWTTAPRTVAPWQEPVRPPGVANDPERLALWQPQRDAAYRSWLRDQPPPAGPRRDELYEVTGCGSAQLYACHTGRRGARSCARLVWPIGEGTYLACRDGAAVRWQAGAPSCAAEPAADEAACTRACAPGDGACFAACAMAADDQCRRDGLDALGLCGKLDDTRLQLAAAAASAAARAATRPLVDELVTCDRGCGEDARALACQIDCTTVALDRCTAIVAPAGCAPIARTLGALRGGQPGR